MGIHLLNFHSADAAIVLVPAALSPFANRISLLNDNSGEWMDSGGQGCNNTCHHRSPLHTPDKLTECALGAETGQKYTHKRPRFWILREVGGSGGALSPVSHQLDPGLTS